MKSKILYIVIFSILYVKNNSCYSQRLTLIQSKIDTDPPPPTCEDVGNFGNVCSGQLYLPSGLCPTWTTACGGGWVRSHGSPNMIPYTTVVNGNTVSSFYAFMWATYQNNTVHGEGMFKPYTFEPLKTYEVRLRIGTSILNSTNPGQVLIFAATSLGQSYFGECGDDLPINIYTELIGTVTGLHNTPIDVTFLYEPCGFFGNIWIYPVAATTAGGQFNAGVYSVKICPTCEGAVRYHYGAVTPFVTTAGYIYAGSSVTDCFSGNTNTYVEPDYNTTFEAAHDIFLLPEFGAQVNTGVFTAKIVNCVTAAGGTVEDSVDVEMATTDEANIDDEMEEKFGINESSPISIYPTIATHLLTIKTKKDDLSQSRIRIYDQYNRIVYRSFNNLRATSISINLPALHSGMYFIEIINKGSRVIRKFMIL